MIDIGSNSVRLVVYDGLKRAPMPIFNEKAMCALGKGLTASGKLNPEGVAQADAALGRFITLTRLMEARLEILATAAVREAMDGKLFIRYLEEKFDARIDVISGKREAKLAAAGIFSSIHQSEGVAGDLGGGSLELVALKGEMVEEYATLPVGPLRLVDEANHDPRRIRQIIEKGLDEVKWLTDAGFPNFYAIGGSFRALAKAQMQETGYPLSMLHHYAVRARDMRRFLSDIIALPAEEMGKLPGIPGKRSASMLPAALVMDAVLQRAQPGQVIISAHGIREGWLYDQLSPKQQDLDGLLAGCGELAGRYRCDAAYAQELFVWMYPLFQSEDERQRRLRLAFCTLSEIAEHIHPEFRAEWAFGQALQTPLLCIDHGERVQIAAALYFRYQAKLKQETAVWSLLTPATFAWARLAGAAAGLAYLLSGGIHGHLHKTLMTLEKGHVTLGASGIMQRLLTEAVHKRVDDVQAALSASFSSAR